MKILLASDSYLYQTNGVSTVVISLASRLRAWGHEVKVLAPSATRVSHREGDDYLIGSIPAVYYPDQRVCFSRHDPLVAELTAWKPDVVHVHTESSMLRLGRKIASGAGAPMVMTAHTDYAQYLFHGLSSLAAVRLLARTWGKITYRGVDTVILPSEKALSFPQMKSIRSRTAVIPNGVNPERMSVRFTDAERKAFLRSVGFEDDGYLLVMVTRVSREKNIREILDYFPSLLKIQPKAHLLIVGDGKQRKALERWCRKAGLSERVRFPGRIPPEDVARYYALGNVFVSASTFEVHSLTYLEAMACGVPLVCREDPCLKGVLEDGVNGFTYRTREEFTEKTARLLADRDLWERMSREAETRAAAFSEDAAAERTLALYREIARWGNPSAR